MKDNENKVRKVCSFYVNDLHLTTMLLPHINHNIQSNVKVLTLFQNGIKNNIDELLSRMNLNNNTQEQILAINWTSTPVCKYTELKHQLENINKDIDAIEIIVSGTDDYIDAANSCIEKVIEDLPCHKITIINCYDISKYNDINPILDKHDLVLNTSGIKQIEEVFTDYKRPDIKIG